MLLKFSNLIKGIIEKEFIQMIKPIQLIHHKNHIEEIKDNSNSFLGFEVSNSIYKPNLTSSSIFVLRLLLRKKRNYNKLLDMGTGSGILGLTLKKEGFCNNLVLTDVNKDAIQCASNNAKNLKIEANCVESNLFSNIKEKFDCIIFNLPLLHTSEEVSKDELSLSDFRGNIATTFFNEADSYLNNNGEIIFTYSNLSNPEILTKMKQKWDINLIGAEYVEESGVWFFLYSGKLI